MTERDWRIFREDFNISYKVIINSHVECFGSNVFNAYNIRRQKSLVDVVALLVIPFLEVYFFVLLCKLLMNEFVGS